MQWLIQLSGNELDLKKLSESLKSAALSIIKEDDGYYLKSFVVNQIDEASGVQKKAENILQLINGSMHLALGSRGKINIECLKRINEDHKKTIFAYFNDEMGVRSNNSQKIQRNDSTIEEIHQADPILGWLILAENNENVAKVFRLLGKGEYKWVNLRRIYEVIENDVGGESVIVDNGWTTRNQIERFTRTANSEGAIGDEARHGSERTAPPPNPMQYSEAESFIKTLIHSWLRAKVER